MSENLYLLLDSVTTFSVASDSLAVYCELLIGKQISHRCHGVDGKGKYIDCAKIKCLI